ncbi:MAG: DsrE family protein, partial [bacterium]
MKRRIPFFVGALVLIVLGVFIGMSIEATNAQSTHNTKKQKVVYHLNEVGKVKMVLNNIKNHIKGVGGPENVDIVLVVHGPAYAAFLKEEIDPNIQARLEVLQDQGVETDMCGNTMRKFGVVDNDLIDGFQRHNDFQHLANKKAVYLRQIC